MRVRDAQRGALRHRGAAAVAAAPDQRAGSHGRLPPARARAAADVPGRNRIGGSGTVSELIAAQRVEQTRSTAEPLLRVENLTKHFPVRGGFLGNKQYVRAVDGV